MKKENLYYPLVSDHWREKIRINRQYLEHTVRSVLVKSAWIILYVIAKYYSSSGVSQLNWTDTDVKDSM